MSVVISFGLSDREGRPLHPAVQRALLSAVEAAITTWAGDATVYFQGEGVGTYTNADGVTYREPAYTYVLSACGYHLTDAIAKLVALSGQESIAVTRGETAIVAYDLATGETSWTT